MAVKTMNNWNGFSEEQAVEPYQDSRLKHILDNRFELG